MRYLIALLLTLTCCVPSYLTPRLIGIRNEPMALVSFHADTGFTPRERTLIDTCMASIEEQTSGIVRLNVVYDLDFGDLGSLTAHGRSDVIVRAPIDAPYVVMEDESGQLLGHVFGIDLRAYDPTAQKRVYIVADRLVDDATFTHVVMHELYHSIGAQHTIDEASIMSRYVSRSPTTCMTKQDAISICERLGCVADDMNYCVERP